MVIETLYKLIVCHLLGDYVLQSDFIAQTKGKNWYHLIVHCFLYSVPFAVVFGIDWRILLLIAIHIPVDALKARWQKIGYVADQVIHILALCVYLLRG